jgi:hypothetical protein
VRRRWHRDVSLDRLFGLLLSVKRRVHIDRRPEQRRAGIGRQRNVITAAVLWLAPGLVLPMSAVLPSQERAVAAPRPASPSPSTSFRRGCPVARRTL